MATSDVAHTDRPVEHHRAANSYGALRLGWIRFWRFVSHYMPKRLYARSLIIVITPMILLQSVIAFVFMERHWQTVTQRLCRRR